MIRLLQRQAQIYLIVFVKVSGLPVLIRYTHTSILTGTVKEGPARALFYYLSIFRFILVCIQISIVLWGESTYNTMSPLHTSKSSVT